jgi:ketosteroid isomerase-like protein
MTRLIAIALACSIVARSSAAQHLSPHDSAGVVAFNTALERATRTMNTAATLALWADDGVSLMPQVAPITGKPSIKRFIDGVRKDIAGATMQRFTMRCFDILGTPPIATEWCVEHQVVLLPDQKTFDSWGRLALVLRADTDGQWRLKQETWLPGIPSDSSMLRR